MLNAGIIDTVGDATAVSKYNHHHNNTHSSISNLCHCPIEPTTVECIITQSIAITKHDKKHQTLISKNN